jgi:outer membrane protein OmpA-like peptidoglycan-associated protein
VNAQGCPVDSDGDGVCDGIDHCPNTPTGCKVDAQGCPIDSDGDGVCDGLDKCPDTPAGSKVNAEGCPPTEVEKRETELLDTGMIRLQDVKFETAKANILPESYPALDAVGQVLSKWPQLKIEIDGHTDSRGSDSYNLALSHRRADSVRAYLLQHFNHLEAGQLTTKGYGESKPLVPNTSPANMAQNRRVEFTVLNKEMLQQLKR